MPKEDYLLKYLEKLSRVVAAMLGLRDKGFPEDAIRLADETFKDMLSLNLEAIYILPVEQFISKIKSESYQANYIEQLAKITLETAQNYCVLNKIKEMNVFNVKALHLYYLLNEKDKTFSFERQELISNLEEKIKN